MVDELRNLIIERRVVLLVGSGVSVGATGGEAAASWIGLLKDGIKRGEELMRGTLAPGWGNRQREALGSKDTDEMISVAENVAGKLHAPNGPEYRDWLRDSVGSLRVKDGHGEVLEALRDLALPTVTTNYDGLLTEVTGAPPVTWRERSEVERVLRREVSGILHVHGHWAQPASVVLGARSYEQVSADDHAQTVLKVLRTTHSLLFVGFGAGLHDPNFGPFLRWTRETLSAGTARHFRLALESEVAEIERSHPPEERIFVLSYGKTHGDLAPFLRSLRTTPQAGDAAPPSWLVDPLVRESNCFGREQLIEELVGTLVSSTPRPTIVLGPPGIGKSTVTIEALWDSRVMTRFGARRYLVRLDGATTAARMVDEIAHTLGLAHERTAPEALVKVLGVLPSVLVLDNMETPWESERRDVERLLTVLSGTPGLALVGSVRGNEAPLIRGSRNLVRVPQIDAAAATDLLCSIAGEEHRGHALLPTILASLDGIPLVITLFASEVNGVGFELAWRRWQSESIKLPAQPDQLDRLTSVAVSLAVSIKSPRMTDEASRLLAVLARLPDGMPIDHLEHFLSGSGYAAAAVLCKVGLAYQDASYLRMLAPLREHVSLHHAPRPEDLEWMAPPTAPA